MWHFLFVLAVTIVVVVPMARLFRLFRRPGARRRGCAAIPPQAPSALAGDSADVPVHGTTTAVPSTQPQARDVTPVPAELPDHTPVRVRPPSEPRFELIPRKMSGINARLVLPEALWSQLSTMVIDANGGNCCECPNEPRTRMECHEVWKYEWVRRPGRTGAVGVMRLVGLQPLCHLCHMGKHIKYAESHGELPQVMAHLMKLHDGLTAERIGQLMREAVAKSELKYRYEELDLRYLNAPQFAPIRARFGRDFTDNDMRKPVPA